MPVKLAAQSLRLGQHPALLVVDASRGFTDPESPLGADFSGEIAVITALMQQARQRDWSCWLSTVSYHDDAQASVFRHKIPALNTLRAGSEAVAIDPRLPLDPADTVFSKTHASCFFATGLEQRLRQHGVDSLIVAGFTTSGCVRASAVDALQCNFPTVVVADAVGDRDQAAHQANLYDLAAKYTEVQTYNELIGGLQ